MFSYRSILKQSWNIAWKHKYLWIFGLFASIAAASGSFEYQIISTGLQNGALENSYYQINHWFAILAAISQFLIGFSRLFSYDILTIINVLSIVIVTFILIVSFFWLAISSQGALVVSVKKLLTAKKKAPDLNLRENLAVGHRHFWPILGFNVLAKVIISLILVAVSLPLILLTLVGAPYLALIYTFTFLILVPIAVSCALILKYAIAFQVLEKGDFFSSLKKAWQLFIDSWLISLEMGILLFIISFLFGFIILIFLALVVFPYFIFALSYGLTWLIILLGLLTLIIVILSGSFITTFQIATWTNLFLELRGGKGEAKLERLAKPKAKNKK